MIQTVNLGVAGTQAGRDMSYRESVGEVLKGGKFTWIASCVTCLLVRPILARRAFPGHLRGFFGLPRAIVWFVLAWLAVRLASVRLKRSRSSTCGLQVCDGSIRYGPVCPTHPERVRIASSATTNWNQE